MKKNFYEMSRSNKILILTGMALLASLLIWVLICLLLWLLNWRTQKTWDEFCKVIFSGQGGKYFLISLAVSVAGLIYFIVRYHEKLGGKAEKEKRIKQTDIDPKWLPQSELEKRIVVLKDDVSPIYPTFCIEGIDNVIDPKTKKKVSDIGYHILACDRHCLQMKYKDLNKPLEINGNKPINNLIAGATIVCGAARSGKTKQIVKPTLLHLLKGKSKSSMIICDLKGDIFKMTGNLAKEQGYNVLRFNTTNPKFSHSWNALGEIWDLYYNEYLPNLLNEQELRKGKTPDKNLSNKENQLNQTNLKSVFKSKYQVAKSEIETRLEIIVSAIAPIPQSANEPYWYKSAQLLIKLYFLILLDYGIKKEDYTLFNICSNAITCQDKIQILNDSLPKWAISKYYVGQFKGKEGQKDFSSIKSIAQSTLETFTIQEIKNLTTPAAEGEINFRNFVEKPTVIYLSIDISNKDSAANKLAILFMESLYAFLNKYLNTHKFHDEEAFENPVLFIIDEFGNLPKMEYMPKMFSLAQGKNIIPMLIVQSPSQLYKTYGKELTKELFDSAQCILLCSGVDVEFAQWLSQRSGSSYRKSFSKSVNDDGKISQSEGMTKMNDIDLGEFTMIQPTKEVVILPLGMKPSKVKVIGAENNKWINEVQDSLVNAKDVDYGEKADTEIDFFENALDKRIIGLWIKKIICRRENADKLKVNLAYELKDDPFFKREINIDEINIDAMDKYYSEYGSFPSLAIKLATNSNNLLFSIEDLKKSEPKEASEPTEKELDDLMVEANKHNTIKKQFDKTSLKEMDFQKKLKISLNGIKKEYHDEMPNYLVLNFLFVAGYINEISNLPSKCGSLERYEKILDFVKHSSKRVYWDLIDPNNTEDGNLSVEQLAKKYHSILISDKTSIDNSPYVIHLINRMAQASTSNDPYDEICKYFGLKTGKELVLLHNQLLIQVSSRIIL